MLGLLLRMEAIGLPTFGLLLYGVWVRPNNMGALIDTSTILWVPHYDYNEYKMPPKSYSSC